MSATKSGLISVPYKNSLPGSTFTESINATRLGERMKIIGGDAHWREVIHFLLSALIENDRLTDLVVATEVLSEVDELPDSPFERAFHRRMALGAAIVSRLLAEGWYLNMTSGFVSFSDGASCRFSPR